MGAGYSQTSGETYEVFTSRHYQYYCASSHDVELFQKVHIRDS